MMRRWIHRRPHRPAASTHGDSSTATLSGNHLALEQHARHVLQRLQELGPAHSCLALYLASRLDVLPAEYCREFASASDSSQVLSPAQAQAILGQELGTQFDRVFGEFDFLPFQSTLITQSHYGRLRTGTEVVVLLLHPFWYGLQNRIVPEFLNVTEIETLFGDLLPIDVLTDFSTALRRKADLTLLREALELLARDSTSFESLSSPKTFAELSTAKLLTIERLPAPSLLVQHQDNVARRLCHVWLQQAVHGHCFPVDLQMRNIYLYEDNRISFLGCEFVGLPSSTRENLSKYLGALMAHDPDTAAMYLLREMAPRHAHHKIDTELFRTNFRQAAYFGMLEPILGTDSNALAQLVFQHWKTALDHGYVPQSHLLCFYRGLFSVAKIARHLSPNTDALHEGMEEFQTSNVFGQMRELMDWRYWYENADKFASAMAHMPHTLDDALNHASALPLDNMMQRPSSREPAPTRYSPGDFILLLVLLILILQLPVSPGWSGKIMPLVLMLAGVVVLLKKL